MTYRILAVLVLLTPALVAQPAPTSSSQLADFVRLYEADANDLSRFDDLDLDETRPQRLEQLDSLWADRLSKVEFDQLSASARIDHVLLRNHWAHERAQHRLSRRRIDQMEQVLPFRRAILDLELARRQMKHCAPESAAGVVAEIPGQIKKLRESLDRGRPASQPATSTAQSASLPSLRITASVALRAANATASLRKTLDEWAAYHDGFDPEFSWWIKQPLAAADKGLDEYAKYLRETIAKVKGEPDDPLIGDPIGAESLEADLRYEMIAYSPGELIEIADRELAWCEGEMKKAAAEMGFGADWKAALAKVKEDHAPPGAQAELVRDEARSAIDFLKHNDLLTIPPLCEETWRLEMLSQKRQQVLPFAVYGGQEMDVAYPTDAFTHEDKLMSMRGNNRAFTHIVTPHELIPGHHLQLFIANRSNTHRRLFRTPFFVEGWALYWEMQLWNRGWGQTPQQRIGMLFWRMHRCARVIVSLKFHLGEMAPKEMIEILVDRVGHERFGATSEVRRFIGGMYSPLYQCAYLIGGLQIRALHDDLVPAKMTDKQFNDTLLTFNSIPIELIRAAMTNATIEEDFKARWHFAQ